MCVFLVVILETQEFFGIMEAGQHGIGQDGDDDKNVNDEAANQPTGQEQSVNQTAAPAENDAVQGQSQNGATNTTSGSIDSGADDVGETGDKENVEPQHAPALPTVPPRPQESATQQPLNAPNNNQVIKCFKCVETFVQEPAFYDHLEHFHKMVVKDKSEPGQFVRNPNKRKRAAVVDENGNDETGIVVKRKAKKPLTPVN